MKQIEILTSDDPWDLQQDVNEFLKDQEATSITVTTTEINRNACFTAVIEYKKGGDD